MQVQVNSDNSIEFGSIAADGAEERVRERLARFADRLTRVEVHMRDVDGTDLATGQGLEVMLEARPSGSQPLTVLHRAQSSRDALNGALAKLTARLETAFGKANRIR